MIEDSFIDSGYLRSPADHRDWMYRDLVMAADRRSLPAEWEVDKRSPLTPYQQGQVPSCVGWMMAMLKTVHERKDQFRTIKFDGMAFYVPIAQPGGGAYLRDAFDRARLVGVPDERGKLYKIKGYAAVNPRDHEAVKHAIHSNRGLVIGFAVTRRWMAGGGQEFRVRPGQSPDDIVGHHGMYVSGYKRSGPQGLNSWGPTWSEDGRAVLDWAYWDKHVWECWTVLDADD